MGLELENSSSNDSNESLALIGGEVSPAAEKGFQCSTPKKLMKCVFISDLISTSRKYPSSVLIYSHQNLEENKDGSWNTFIFRLILKTSLYKDADQNLGPGIFKSPML